MHSNGILTLKYILRLHFCWYSYNLNSFSESHTKPIEKNPQSWVFLQRLLFNNLRSNECERETNTQYFCAYRSFVEKKNYFGVDFFVFFDWSKFFKSVKFWPECEECNSAKWPKIEFHSSIQTIFLGFSDNWIRQSL